MPQVIKYEDRHLIRDIFIPLAGNLSDDHGMQVNEAALDRAYCYTGGSEPKLLFDGNDHKLVHWLMNIYGKAERAPRGAKNWRIEHEGTMFRAHRGITVDGPDLVLRTVPQETPTLEEINIPLAWREIYLDPALLYGGLVLTTAKNGMAKTTVISAAVRSRLEKFGGHANCVEDPPELPLHGMIGKGACRQIPVGVDAEGDDVVVGAGFADALRDVRREFPSMTGGGTVLMIGEIRDNETAAETLLAAFEGHLVLATFHSASIQSAMHRLSSMAGAVLGHDQAKSILAAVLRAAFHQTLTLKSGSGNEGWKRGEIKGKALVMPPTESNPLAKLIEEGQFGKLQSIVDEQNKKLETLTNIADIRRALAPTQ